MILLLNRCPLIKTDHITKRLFDPYEQVKFYKRKELYSNPGSLAVLATHTNTAISFENALFCQSFCDHLTAWKKNVRI